MKLITNPFNETIYQWQTPSQMTVLLVHKPEFVNQAVGVGTTLSGLTSTIDLNGERLTLKPGLAHFLEHQLFESDAGSIMNDFTEVGASVNAYTSYHETVYYFATTNSLKKPLHLLMDMMVDAKLTQQSVQKEKGIIIQELAMYEQMPEARLIRETFANLYENHPLKFDIGGSAESVSATELKDLMQAYDLFYNPKNLVMVIVSHHPIATLKNWVLEHPLSHKTNRGHHLKTRRTWEPLVETSKIKSTIMDITQNKVIVSVPLLPETAEADSLLVRWGLRVLLESHFSEMNPDYQTWLDAGTINALFDYDVDVEADYGHVLFLFENIDHHDARAFVIRELQKLSITQAQLEQLKKRWFFASLRVFNNPSSIMLRLLHYHLKTRSYFDLLHILNDLSLADVKAAQRFLADVVHVTEIKGR